MGAFSIWHWLIVLVVVLVLFGGGGKISRLMGDFGKGLKSFKKGMKEEEADEGDTDAKDKKAIENEGAESVSGTTAQKSESTTEKDKATGG